LLAGGEDGLMTEKACWIGRRTEHVVASRGESTNPKLKRLSGTDVRVWERTWRMPEEKGRAVSRRRRERGSGSVTEEEKIIK